MTKTYPSGFFFFFFYLCLFGLFFFLASRWNNSSDSTLTFISWENNTSAHTCTHTLGIIRNTCGKHKESALHSWLECTEVAIDISADKGSKQHHRLFQQVRQNVNCILLLLPEFLFFCFFRCSPPRTLHKDTKSTKLFMILEISAGPFVWKTGLCFVFVLFLLFLFSLCVSVTVGVTSRFLSAAKQQI